MADPSLKDLGQKIELLETQLKSLRSELHSRQSEMDKLQTKKTDLQKQLQQVDKDIASIVQGDGGIVAAPRPKTGKKKKKAASKAKAKPAKKTQAKTKQQVNPRPLREVITDILKQARKPLMTKELAERALASGYQTGSKNFTAVVQDLLKKMDNVERIPKEGYQLKR